MTEHTRTVPDQRGYFGAFGGRFVPETLVPALEELSRAYEACRQDPAFHAQFAAYLRDYVGRPTPLYRADRLAAACGNAGVELYLKREDLTHTGAHKINNTIGQALLAKRMGKKRVIAETGAGQHGVATATAAAALGLECRVFMGEEDMRRQALNVYRMRLLGATMHPVSAGTRTLKEAVSEAIRYWVTHIEDVYYIIGSVVGPDPYPRMVRDFQSVIGSEVKEQLQAAGSGLPDYVVACVGGGSNAAGIFYPFAQEPSVKLIGVEAAGRGLESGRHAAALSRGRPGVLHGAFSYLLQDEHGQITPAHSVSAGLDYPGVGPEHAYYKETGRAEYVAVTDEEALAGFRLLAETEGIIPALESAHAIAHLPKLLPSLPAGTRVVVCLSGRGDKDVAEVSRLLNMEDGGEAGDHA